jgi:hypothetical protein
MYGGRSAFVYCACRIRVLLEFHIRQTLVSVPNQVNAVFLLAILDSLLGGQVHHRVTDARLDCLGPVVPEANPDFPVPYILLLCKRVPCAK